MLLVACVKACLLRRSHVTVLALPHTHFATPHPPDSWGREYGLHGYFHIVTSRHGNDDYNLSIEKSCGWVSGLEWRTTEVTAGDRHPLLVVH